MRSATRFTNAAAQLRPRAFPFRIPPANRTLQISDIAKFVSGTNSTARYWKRVIPVQWSPAWTLTYRYVKSYEPDFLAFAIEKISANSSHRSLSCSDIQRRRIALRSRARRYNWTVPREVINIFINTSVLPYVSENVICLESFYGVPPAFDFVSDIPNIIYIFQRRKRSIKIAYANTLLSLICVMDFGDTESERSSSSVFNVMHM